MNHYKLIGQPLRVEHDDTVGSTIVHRIARHLLRNTETMPAPQSKIENHLKKENDPETLQNAQGRLKYK